MLALTQDSYKGKCYVTINKVPLLLYVVVVTGTTFSGHPTDTTWGNSINQVMYVLFTMYISGVAFDYLV